MTSLIDEYFILTKKHRLEYPGKSILLMLVGAFYEVYGIKNESNNFDDKYSNIYDFSKLCDLAVSKKGHKYKNTDLYMAGFRDYSLEKYLIKLTQNGFRCFVYDQFDEGKNPSTPVIFALGFGGPASYRLARPALAISRRQGASAN